MLDKDTVKHVAKLSRLEIKDDEIETVSKKMGDILSYIEKLQGVDTENTDITYNPINLVNQFRKDEVKESLEVKKVLQNAPEKEMGCFKVPKVLD